MADELSCKQAVYAYCQHFVETRIETLKGILASLAESRNSETKSSVGDKYETGRSMVQLEEAKINQQLQEAWQARTALAAIDPGSFRDVVGKGSMVRTSIGTYFIGIAVGKITLPDAVIYGISPEAPLAKALAGKKKGEEAYFNNQRINIEAVE